MGGRFQPTGEDALTCLENGKVQMVLAGIVHLLMSEEV